jgi:hypothetical protein
MCLTEKAFSESHMWKSIDQAQSFSKRSTWTAVVLAFLSGSAGLWALIDISSKVATFSAVGFAFLSGLAGLLAIVADKQKDKVEIAFKKTRPDIAVDIKTGQEDEQFYVVIQPRNKVPFECCWRIVTQENQVVSGVMLDWAKIVPDDKHRLFLHRANIDLNRVINDYLELRFEYRSAYAAELNESSLKGDIVRRYKLSPDKKCCILVE